MHLPYILVNGYLNTFELIFSDKIYSYSVRLKKRNITHNKSESFELESPLLGGDLGVGKSVIRELFTEISRPRNPPLTPPKRGIVESPPMRGIICAIIKLALVKTGICEFKLNRDNRSLLVSSQNPYK